MVQRSASSHRPRSANGEGVTIKITRARLLIVLGALTLLAAVTLAGFRLQLLPKSWGPAQSWVGLLAAATGGASTLTIGLYEAAQDKGRARREEIDRLVDALKWDMHDRHSISPFDLGFAVWQPRPDRGRRLLGRSRRLSDASYRSRSRNRHASTGIEWTFGKGVIGRCIETGDIVGVDLEDLWGNLRGCDERTWLAQPEVEVRQQLSYAEFVKVQGSGTVITGGHLNYVLAVPILARSGGKVLGCVALDLPAADMPPAEAERHYIVQGLRAVADVLGS